MVGVDFFLHAGLLAPRYDWGSPFLLGPDVAFARISIGYLGFLLLAIGLAWLLTRLEVGRVLGVALSAVVLQTIGYATAPVISG